MRARALGISPHTGWAACVVVGGSLARPDIVANEIVQILGDDQRFCYHMAMDMRPRDAARWIARVRAKALANAKRALAPLLAQGVSVAAIVAKDGDPGDLARVLASHPRIHTAEGVLYRDVFRDACTVPVKLIAPATLDHAKVGKLAPAPWGKDQRLAALAAWTALGRAT